MASEGFATQLRHGLRSSIRNNYTAYGFSIMITASFGVVSAILHSPSAGEVFLFIGGAVGGFTSVEAIVSGGFRHGPRGESSDVVALGTAFSFVSVGSGVGTAALIATVLDASIAWLAGPFAATCVYVVGQAVELAVAERIKKS